jgi:hypothetical protein
MLNRIRKVGLLTFLKGSSNPSDHMPGCANYDQHYGGCLFSETCKVEYGHPCRHFEKAVLPTSNGIGQGISITSQYEARVHCTAGRFSAASREDRRCPDCGNPLLPRRRYCEKCRGRRKRIATRNRAKVFRVSQRNKLTVKETDEIAKTQ